MWKRVRDMLVTLLESEQRYRATFSQAAVGIAHLAPDGTWLQMNGKYCQILGYSEEELMSRNIQELIHPDSWQDVLQKVQQLLGGEIPDYSHEVRYIRKDRTQIWIKSTCSMVRGAADVDGFVLHVVEDITSRKMAEEALQVAMDDLERQVESRTRSLLEANRELQRQVEERRRVEENLRKQQGKVQALAHEVSISEERERARIAGELHDQVGHNLLVAKMRLDLLEERAPMREEIRGINTLIAQAITDIRSLTFQLRPPILATANLEAALRWLAEELHETWGLQVDIDDDRQPKPLIYEVRSFLFQVIRELLFNVIKHAGVQAAKLLLRREGGWLCVTVLDRGAGCNVEEALAKYDNDAGFGLFNVQQRIRMLKGSFEMQSRDGEGTRITIRVPLDGADDAEVSP